MLERVGDYAPPTRSNGRLLADLVDCEDATVLLLAARALCPAHATTARPSTASAAMTMR